MAIHPHRTTSRLLFLVSLAMPACDDARGGSAGRRDGVPEQEGGFHTGDGSARESDGSDASSGDADEDRSEGDGGGTSGTSADEASGTSADDTSGADTGGADADSGDTGADGSVCFAAYVCQEEYAFGCDADPTQCGDAVQCAPLQDACDELEAMCRIPLVACLDTAENFEARNACGLAYDACVGYVAPISECDAAQIACDEAALELPTEEAIAAALEACGRASAECYIAHYVTG